MISDATLTEIFYDYVCKMPWMGILDASGMEAAFASADSIKYKIEA
jgi:hypothetical protein